MHASMHPRTSLPTCLQGAACPPVSSACQPVSREQACLPVSKDQLAHLYAGASLTFVSRTITPFCIKRTARHLYSGSIWLFCLDDEACQPAPKIRILACLPGSASLPVSTTMPACLYLELRADQRNCHNFKGTYNSFAKYYFKHS